MSQSKGFPLFSQHLAESRQKKGISQLEAAKKIGVSPSTWSLWESGDRVPRSASQLHKLCNLFDVSADWLLGINCIQENDDKKDIQQADKEHDFETANKLFKLRKDKGWNISETARHVGVAPATWSNWETGKWNIRQLIHAIRICETFDVSWEWLNGKTTDKGSFDPNLYKMVGGKANRRDYKE